MFHHVLTSDYGGFVVEVTDVLVDGTHACFGGPTVDAWGRYAGETRYRWTLITDGGESGIDVDGARGGWISDGWASVPANCKDGTRTVYLLSTGNFQVHVGESEA